MSNINIIKSSSDLSQIENCFEGEIVYAMDTQSLFVHHKGVWTQFASYNANIAVDTEIKKKNYKKR